jgi:hypothetical protein
LECFSFCLEKDGLYLEVHILRFENNSLCFGEGSFYLEYSSLYFGFSRFHLEYVSLYLEVNSCHLEQKGFHFGQSSF